MPERLKPAGIPVNGRLCAYPSGMLQLIDERLKSPGKFSGKRGVWTWLITEKPSEIPGRPSTLEGVLSRDGDRPDDPEAPRVTIVGAANLQMASDALEAVLNVFIGRPQTGPVAAGPSSVVQTIENAEK